MTTSFEKLPADIKAEAAAWLARVRFEDRAAEDLAGLREWLAEDPRHAQAFELVTGAWDATGGAAADWRPARRAKPARPAVGRRELILAAAATLVASVGVTTWRKAAGLRFETDIGERRQIALADGTAVTLDTDSEIRVMLGDARRTVQLLRGRAKFDVASDPRRPFLVEADGREVIALGTVFDVSRRGGRLEVVLEEGHVVVQPLGAQAGLQRRHMAPGDRLTFEQRRPVAADRPDIAQATAWRAGRAVFTDEPLAEAVIEMNRYAREPLVIADPALGAMRVSGVYDTGDIRAFANSLAVLLPASVVYSDGQIVISSLPAAKHPTA